MPAAAVTPAPIAYIKVVAVKKLVVELWGPFEWDWAGVWGAPLSFAAGRESLRPFQTRPIFPLLEGSNLF